METKREQLFSVFEEKKKKKNFSETLDAKGRFYKLVTLLPENQRNDLTSIYRNLKLESIKLRLSNGTLLTYLSGIKSTLKEFFDLAFPDRAGKMYTKQGTHFSHDMRSLVLNSQF
jgi:hypothetical protein